MGLRQVMPEPSGAACEPQDRVRQRGQPPTADPMTRSTRHRSAAPGEAAAAAAGRASGGAFARGCAGRADSEHEQILVRWRIAVAISPA